MLWPLLVVQMDGWPNDKLRWMTGLLPRKLVGWLARTLAVLPCWIMQKKNSTTRFEHQKYVKSRSFQKSYPANNSTRGSHSRAAWPIKSMLVFVLKCPSQHTSKCVKCTSGARAGTYALSLFSSYIVRALARSLARWLGRSIDRSPNHSIVWPLTTTLARSLVRSLDRNDFGNGISNYNSVPILLARFQFRIETARQIYFACVRTENYCSAGVRPSIFIFSMSAHGGR